MLYGVNVFPFNAQEIPKCVCLLRIGRYSLVTINNSRKWERTSALYKEKQLKGHCLIPSYCYY